MELQLLKNFSDNFDLISPWGSLSVLTKTANYYFISRNVLENIYGFFYYPYISTLRQSKEK